LSQTYEDGTRKKLSNRESEEMNVQSGVVYMTKCRGLRALKNITGRNMLRRKVFITSNTERTGC